MPNPMPCTRHQEVNELRPNGVVYVVCGSCGEILTRADDVCRACLGTGDSGDQSTENTCRSCGGSGKR